MDDETRWNILMRVARMEEEDILWWPVRGGWWFLGGFNMAAWSAAQERAEA